MTSIGNSQQQKDLNSKPISASGTFTIGDLVVHRLGYGAMQITGPGVWGPPKDVDEAIRVLRLDKHSHRQLEVARAAEGAVDVLGENLAGQAIDREALMAEALEIIVPLL